MRILEQFLLAGLAAAAISLPAPAAAQGTGDGVLCIDEIQAGESPLIFRWKVGLVSTDCGSEACEGDGCEEECEGDGCAEPPCEGEECEEPPCEGEECGETPPGEGITTVDAEIVPGSFVDYTGSDLSVTRTLTGERNVGQNRIVYQCFQASGASGNYWWLVAHEWDRSGDWSWIESYDVVTRDRLYDPALPTPFVERWGADYMIAPRYEGGPLVRVDHAGEMCVRARVAEGASYGESAFMTVYLESYGAGQLVDADHFHEDDFWYGDDYSSFVVELIPDCEGGCMDSLRVAGPAHVAIDLGDNYFPWTAEGGTHPYSWSISGSGGALTLPPHDFGIWLHAQEAGFYEVTVTVTDGAMDAAHLEATVAVNQPDPIEIFGPSDLTVTLGDNDFPWWATGGTPDWDLPGGYEWEIDAPAGLWLGEGDWGSITLSAGAVGVYEEVILIARDSLGEEGVRVDLNIAVVAPEAGMLAWGNNSMRVFGDGTNSHSLEPKETGVHRDWTALSAGTNSCGIAGGDLYCWSSHSWGLNGLGQGVAQTAPDVPVEPAGNWTHVAAFDEHVCGIRNGSLYCWGSNGYGELGTGSTTMQRTPALVSSGGWTAVSTGRRHSCGIRYGQAYCWGSNQFGETGVGSTGGGNRTTPVQVAGGLSGWSDISAGWNFSCGIAGGNMYCWGDNASGKLGSGGSGGADSPVQITGDAGGWTAVQAGHGHACGLRAGGEARCWGSNQFGQLGDGGTDDRGLASLPVGGSDWQKLSVGRHHACATRSDSTAWCWGQGTDGRLGLGPTTATNSSVPQQIGAGHDWQIVAAGDVHTLGFAQANGAGVQPPIVIPPYDPGVPCNEDRRDGQVCEDYSPPIDDPVYREWTGRPGEDDDEELHGSVPANIGAIQWFAFQRDAHPGVVTHHQLVETGKSSLSLTSTGMPFSYACYKATGGNWPSWWYSVHFGQHYVWGPRWFLRIDIVPRDMLFAGDVAWNTEHEAGSHYQGFPAEFPNTTSETDICVRLVVREPFQTGTDADTSATGWFNIHSSNGTADPLNRMLEVWGTPVTPQERIAND